MLGKWLSNVFDPRRADAGSHHFRYLADIGDGPDAMRRAWQTHLEWVHANVIGPPQVTKAYTSAQLSEMGMVGIYAPNEKPAQEN